MDEILQGLVEEAQRTDAALYALGDAHIRTEQDAYETVQDTFADVEGLTKELHELDRQATETQLTMQTITRDIGTLDVAKRNITGCMTTLQRLVMAVEAVDQLQVLTVQRRYKECGHLLLVRTSEMTKGVGYCRIAGTF
jgi:hypothetical protein